MRHMYPVRTLWYKLVACLVFLQILIPASAQKERFGVINNALTNAANTVTSQSCEGKFSITGTQDYDPGSNTTTYTWTVTELPGANVNNLSHWGFPVTDCPDGGPSFASVLALGYTAQYSNNGGATWNNASTAYSPDNSQNCIENTVFKFDVGMNNNVTSMMFRLILQGGSYNLIPEIAYVKYGNRCCTIPVQGGECFDRICLPEEVNITGPNNVCPGSSNQYSATAGFSSYAWTITGGTITNTSPD